MTLPSDPHLFRGAVCARPPRLLFSGAGKHIASACMIRALRSPHPLRSVQPLRQHSLSPALAWRAAPTSFDGPMFDGPKPKPDPPPRRGVLVFGCAVGLGLLNSSSSQTGCAKARPLKNCPHFGEKPDDQWVQFVDGEGEHQVVVCETVCEYRATNQIQLDRHCDSTCIYRLKQGLVERALELLKTEHASIPWVREGGIERTEAGAIKVPTKLVPLFKDKFEDAFSGGGDTGLKASQMTQRLMAEGNARLAQLYGVGALSGAPACLRMTCLEQVKDIIHKANRSPSWGAALIEIRARQMPDNNPR